MTQKYFTKMFPGLVAYYFFDLFKSYCNSMSIYNIPIFIQCTMVIFHTIFANIAIQKYQLMGVVYSLNISNIGALIMICLFLKYKNIFP